MTTKNKQSTTNSEPKNQPKKQRYEHGKKKFGAGAVGKKYGKGNERKGYLGKNFRGKDGKIDNSKLQQPPPPLEKPNWIEIKAKKKTQKVDRKKEKFTAEVYELGLQAKQIYEKLKSKRTTNKKELSKELHEVLRNKDSYTKLVLSHDIARVVQCLLKTASVDTRRDIVELLKGSVYQMSISKYAHFCVSHMLKYGSKADREKIINGMLTNIVKMTTHRFSNTIIDLAYNMYATDEQKALMRQEFYSDMYKKQKDKRITKLSDTWTDSEVLKNGILQSTKGNILHAANKKLIDNSLLHAVMSEYLVLCSEENRSEVITAFAPILAALPSTKEGSATAVQCFLHAGNKERRAILKALKEHVPKLCVHEHGHLFLLTILNTIDDTVMLKKQILSAVLENIKTIVASEWGRKVIEWIVSPDDTFYFHPSLVQALNEASKFGKKDAAVRRAEILAGVETEICEAIAKDGKFWLRGGHTALTVVAILKNVHSEPSQKAYSSLASVICDPAWEVFPNEADIIEDDEETAEESDLKITPSIVVKNKIKKFDNDDDEDSEESSEDETEPEKMEEDEDSEPEQGSDDEEMEESTSKKIKKKEDPYAEDKRNALQKKRDLIEMVAGIEHAGLHIALKKLTKLDKEKNEKGKPTLGAEIVENLDEDTIIKWIPLNRACFFLVMVMENGSAEVQKKLKTLIKPIQVLLKKQSHSGAKILLKKL